MATKTKGRDKTPVAPGVKSDAYVGMLALALIAQIAGAAFLWLDYKDYDEKSPKAPDARPTPISVKQDQPVVPPPDKKEDPKEQPKM